MNTIVHRFTTLYIHFNYFYNNRLRVSRSILDLYFVNRASDETDVYVFSEYLKRVPPMSVLHFLSLVPYYIMECSLSRWKLWTVGFHFGALFCVLSNVNWTLCWSKMVWVSSRAKTVTAHSACTNHDARFIPAAFPSRTSTHWVSQRPLENRSNWSPERIKPK